MKQLQQENCSSIRNMVLLPSPPPQPLEPHHAAIYFGLSCAFAALHHTPAKTRDLGINQCRWSRVRELMLQGTAQLLGLVVIASRETVLQEKLTKSELEVEQLRRRRAEDAKANEKVVSIFAAHEQRWFAERKSLRHQLQALVAEMRSLKSKHEEAMSELSRQLEEAQRAMGFKDEAFEQEIKKHEELEDKLKVAQQAAQELREKANKDAQEHSTELWKHKTACVELVSSQRQLEAELARSLRHTEVAKQELKEALERRDEAMAMVEELSVEMARLHKDAEQKDKILSAMLRKSKIDMEDKQMLVKEVKIAKAKKKQAELETERWKKMWESRPRKSSRSSRYYTYMDVGCSDKPMPEPLLDVNPKILYVDHVEGGSKKDEQVLATAKEDSTATTVECIDRYASHVNDKPAVDDYHHMQEWFQMETEKYATMIKHRHNAEIEAFTEQLRLKDDKLETFRWRIVSMDIESTRLRCQIEELEGSLSHYRQQNTELEALLLDKEKEKRSLKEQLSFHAHHCCQRINSKIHTSDDEPHVPRSQVKILRTKSREREQESEEEGEEVRKIEHAHVEMKLTVLGSQKSRDFMHCNNRAFENEATSSSSQVSVPSDNFENRAEEKSAQAPEIIAQEASEDLATTTWHKEEEIEEEKEVSVDPGNVDRESNMISSEEGGDTTAGGPKNSSWKMDIHALSVSYKIKRLKQQLLVLERLQAATAKQQASSRSYQMMMSFLNKQVKRYQSLEEKIDDLCRRMEESKRTGGGGREQNGRSKELGQFLEETFQVQRYMVATGQKLVEMQSKMASTSSSSSGSGGDGIDMQRFMEIGRSLLRDIQRGLEVRIARIIGDLEGTLTCDGILRS